MIIKAWRMTAFFVALAVWFAYSVPAHAASHEKRSSHLLAGIVQTDDDDDDYLSGGALAVLLLAVGGAVAGVLYAAAPSGTTHQTIDLNRAAGNALTVTMNGTDANGKSRRSAWTARLDETSGAIRLTLDGRNGAGRSSHSQWMGKADGRYYPVTGDPTADEFSYTKLDARTLGFKARKAGRVTLTGRIIVSANGRSFTVSADRVGSTGQRVNRQAVYAAR